MVSKKQSTSDKEQQDGVELPTRVSFRLTDEEAQRMTALQKVLQAEFGRYARVTQRVIFLEGLDALEWRLKEKARKRKSGSAES